MPIVEETPDTFIFDPGDGSGQRIPIAKSELSPEKQAQYRSALPQPEYVDAPPQPGLAITPQAPAPTPPPQDTESLSSQVDWGNKPAPAEQGTPGSTPSASAPPAVPPKPLARAVTFADGAQPPAKAPPSAQVDKRGVAFTDDAKPKPAAPQAPQMGGEERALRNAYALEQKAIDEAKVAGQAKAAEEMAYRDETFKQQVALDAQQKEVTGQYDRYRQEQMDKLQGLVAKLSAPDEQIDPNRWWNSRTASQKVMASIGMALGAFGGGTNRAADIINHEIDQDVALQKDAIDRKDRKLGAAITAQSNLFQLMRDNFKDDISATAAAKVALAEQVKSKIDYLTAKYSSPEKQAEADKLKAQLSAQQAKDLGTLNQRTETLGLERAKLDLEALKTFGTLQKGTEAKQLPTTEAAKLGGADGAIKSLDALSKTWDDKSSSWYSGGSQYVGGTDAKEYNVAKAPTAQMVGLYLEDGKLTGEDYPKYMEMMPNAGDSPKIKNFKIQTVKNLIRIKRETGVNAFKAAGYDVSKLEQAAPSSFRPDGG